MAIRIQALRRRMKDLLACALLTSEKSALLSFKNWSRLWSNPRLRWLNCRKRRTIWHCWQQRMPYLRARWKTFRMSVQTWKGSRKREVTSTQRWWRCTKRWTECRPCWGMCKTSRCSLKRTIIFKKRWQTSMLHLENWKWFSIPLTRRSNRPCPGSTWSFRM